MPDNPKTTSEPVSKADELPRQTTAPPGWRPIEHAPKGSTIEAMIWHAGRYWETPARWAETTKAWISTDPFSCVAWVEGISRPAFFKVNAL